MSTNSERIDLHRRHLIGAAAASAAAAQLGMLGSASAQSAKATLPLIKPGTHTSFGPLKNISAGVLNIAYAEAGPSDGPPVILLHGWPYDIHSFVDVTPALASAGYRVLVPYLRGYGATRFLSSETLRNGQPAALAVDVIDFMNALGIENALLAGFDWGCAVGRHRRGALAGACQRSRRRQRLSDRQPGSRQDAAAAESRARMVVSVLLRHGARPDRLRKKPERV